jgi:hypothetical protein
VVSHGICPRHLKKMKLEALGHRDFRVKKSSDQSGSLQTALLLPL